MTQEPRKSSTELNRRAYKNKRFAIPSDAPFLKQQHEAPMGYPDARLAVTAKDGRLGEWRMVQRIEVHAERIAQLYREGIYELINHADYEWHTDPEEIIEKDREGIAKMYALFLDGDSPHSIHPSVVCKPHSLSPNMLGSLDCCRPGRKRAWSDEVSRSSP